MKCTVLSPEIGSTFQACVNQYIFAVDIKQLFLQHFKNTIIFSTGHITVK